MEMPRWTKNLRNALLPRPGGLGNWLGGGGRVWGTTDSIAAYRRGSTSDSGDATAEARFSSAVMGCVEWISIMLPRCPWQLKKREEEDSWEPVMGGHSILDLLEKPTPWHGGKGVLSALLVDYNLGGTGYLQRVGMTQTGPPAELWYTPNGMVRPRWETALDGWDYRRPNGQWERLPVEAFVQVRRGQQPGNPFLGVSPLQALGPEVWMEREAKRMTSSVLKNLGLIGLMVSLKDTKNIGPGEITDAQVRAFKEYLRAAFGGENRGDPLFAEFPVDVHGLTASNPDMIHPKNIHDYVEAAICRLYRLPAAVVQYGLGIEQTTENATLMQYEKQAWETGLIPVGDDIAEQVGRQLLPAFGLDTRDYRLCLDYSGVEVLKEGLDAMSARTVEQWKAGLITRAQAKEKLGYPVETTDHVRLLPINVIEVPVEQTQLEADEERRAALPMPDFTPKGGESDGEGEDDAEDGEGAGSAAKALSARRNGHSRNGHHKAVDMATAEGRRELLRQLRADADRLEADFEGELETAFGDLGRAAARAAEDALP